MVDSFCVMQFVLNEVYVLKELFKIMSLYEPQYYYKKGDINPEYVEGQTMSFHFTWAPKVLPSAVDFFSCHVLMYSYTQNPTA